MHFALPFQPIFHGAAGPWDEVINLIPVVVGALLLLYLYVSGRRRKGAEHAAEPPADQQE